MYGIFAVETGGQIEKKLGNFLDSWTDVLVLYGIFVMLGTLANT